MTRILVDEKPAQAVTLTYVLLDEQPYIETRPAVGNEEPLYALAPQFEGLPPLLAESIRLLDHEFDSATCAGCMSNAVGGHLVTAETRHGAEYESGRWAVTLVVSDAQRAWWLCEDCAYPLCPTPPKEPTA